MRQWQVQSGEADEGSVPRAVMFAVMGSLKTKISSRLCEIYLQSEKLVILSEFKDRIFLEKRLSDPRKLISEGSKH